MSTTTIHFTKMQGAGNDYIYVNTFLYDIADPSAAAIAWSDRHFGIGSDGLVLIGAPSDASKADFSMRIFNADGSEAMMCGNASRCIGKYVYEKGLMKADVIRLETLSGIKTLRLHTANGIVESVTVDMLEPAFDVPEQYAGGRADGVFVSMGNPHFVKFVDNTKDVDVAAEGSLLERDEAFPQRCNIEFAQPLASVGVRQPGQDASVAADAYDRHDSQASDSNRQSFRTRVWERGSGITMACGTGACATAVAAAKVGLAGRKSDIVMDGGTLHIEWSEADNHVYMTGPAEFVFEGEINI